MGRGWRLTVAWVTGLVALGAAVWIVLPAPGMTLASFAVFASARSLWLAVLGAACCGLAAASFHHSRAWAHLLPALAGMTAIGLASLPLLSAREVASGNRAPIAWGTWFGMPPPVETASVETETYATVRGTELKVDIYRARIPSRQPTPAVVVVHGGGWAHGHRSELAREDGWLVQQGFAVFDIDYRLSPQPNWREATGDVKCALGWVSARAERYGASPRDLILLGRSAGAHLALLAAYTRGDRLLPPSCATDEPSVAAVIAFYPPTDLSWGYSHPANPRVIDGPRTLRQFLGGPLESIPEIYALASPINHVTPATPPTLLLQGLSDQFVRPENATRLGERLRAVRVRHRLLLLPYAQHGFDFAYGPLAAVAQAIILQFLVSDGRR